MADDELTPSESTPKDEAPPSSSRLYIPMWVALAGMVVALILGGIIIVTILTPLINLVFPSDPRTTNSREFYSCSAVWMIRLPAMENGYMVLICMDVRSLPFT